MRSVFAVFYRMKHLLFSVSELSLRYTYNLTNKFLMTMKFVVYMYVSLCSIINKIMNVTGNSTVLAKFCGCRIMKTS